jgi:hypothetical protein
MLTIFGLPHHIVINQSLIPILQVLFLVLTYSSSFKTCCRTRRSITCTLLALVTAVSNEPSWIVITTFSQMYQT